MMKQPADVATSMLSYADIAELLGLQVQSVRIYAHSDPDFPTPITPASFRSPGFAEADIRAYVDKRRARNVGKSGRRPTQSLPTSLDGRALGERVRARLQSEQPPQSMKELAKKLGISWNATRYRVSGQARWTEQDVAKLVEIFGGSLLEGIPVDAPNAK